MKRYIRSGWYVGEPSTQEYAEALEESNRRTSTEYCKCVHNNVGWCGVYVTTPYDKYCVVKCGWRYGEWPDTYYTINKYSRGFGSYPAPLIKDKKFASIDDALQYIEDNELSWF